MSKKLTKILAFIISISFISTAFFGCVHFNCFDISFYDSQHDKLELYGKKLPEYIGISKDDLSKLTKFTLDYLNDPEASLDIQMNVKGVNREIFTDDEKAHMVDVRKLNLMANKLLVISIITFVVCRIFYFIKKGSLFTLKQSYSKVLAYFLVIVGLLGLFILIDFDSFWTMFHHIFFSGNDLWLLDLRSDILIMIVPPEFFNHLVIRIVLMFVCAIVLYVLALKFERRYIND